MFARYLHHLPRFATQIAYVCHPALVSLFESSFPDVTICTQPDPQLGDFCLPIGSLPRVLLEVGAAPEPPKHFPYLQTSTEAGSSELQAELNKLRESDRPLLAITWRGSQQDQLAERSTGLEHLLRQIPPEARHQKQIISLQKDPTPNEIKTMNAAGVLDFSPYMTDFNATGIILKRTESLISIDTAIVHLAGALGVPFQLLLNPGGDWKWGKAQASNHCSDRDQGIWYPNHLLTEINNN